MKVSGQDVDGYADGGGKDGGDEDGGDDDCEDNGNVSEGIVGVDDDVGVIGEGCGQKTNF